ncbi:MAG TPA: hypothetical protein HA262_05780 [Methanosarcina sp.]|jgi:hypothetical protein|nr:hypothetical protein [Methanosarcina sp.]
MVSGNEIKDEEKLLDKFDQVLKEHFASNEDDCEKQLSYITVADLFKPFTI